jgi:hypothetical protein
MAKMALTEAQRKRALELIRELRDPTVSEESAYAIRTELVRLLRYPHVSDLLFYEVPELSDEEVIDRALEHKPFEL